MSEEFRKLFINFFFVKAKKSNICIKINIKFEYIVDCLTGTLLKRCLNS